MTFVRYAVVCDFCSLRSREYGRWFVCRECGADTCDTCASPTSGDDETGYCLCRSCSTLDQEQSRNSTKE